MADLSKLAYDSTESTMKIFKEGTRSVALKGTINALQFYPIVTIDISGLSYNHIGVICYTKNNLYGDTGVMYLGAGFNSFATVNTSGGLFALNAVSEITEASIKLGYNSGATRTIIPNTAPDPAYTEVTYRYYVYYD